MKSRNSANDMGQNTTQRVAFRALMLGSFALVLTTTMSLGNAWAASRVQVSTIDVESQETQRTVRIRTGAKPTFTVFKLADPMRCRRKLSLNASTVESEVRTSANVGGGGGSHK